MSLNFTTSSAGTATATSNGLTASGTILLGDLLLLITDVTDGSGSATITDPSGWTSGSALSPTIPNKNVGSNGSDTFHFAVKIAAAGDTGSPTYTTSSSATGYWKQQLRVYSGRVNSSIAAAFGNSAVTADTTVAASFPITYPMTGLTALAGDDIVVVVYGANGGVGQSGATSYSMALTGYANPLATFYTTYNYTGLITSVDQVNASAGATGTLSPVVSKNAGSPTEFVGGFVISLPQSGGGGGGTATIAWVT